MSLIPELKRRNIFRVAILYVASAWLVLQLSDLFIALLGTGEWVYRFVFAVGVICFPLVLVFSWLFEITPQGIRREHLVDRENSITTQTGRRINRAIVMVAAAAMILELGSPLFM